MSEQDTGEQGNGELGTGERAVVEPVAARPVVELRSVVKTFGGAAGRVQALADIDLSISAGEFISLIGPSGCGKSTLLRIVGDLISPSSGDVIVNGKPAHRARLDRDYGMALAASVVLAGATALVMLLVERLRVTSVGAF